MNREPIAIYGNYRVIHDPLAHMPWGLYRVYAGEKYIGGQISYPSESDCRAIEFRREAEQVNTTFTPHRERQAIRRGRPTNVERDRRRRELEEQLGITLPA